MNQRGLSNLEKEAGRRPHPVKLHYLLPQQRLWQNIPGHLENE